MTKKGHIVTKKGKAMVRSKGSVFVHNSKGECFQCCCKPRVVATHTIYNNYGTWDLTAYLGNEMGPPGGYWRLTNNYMSYVPERRGCIDGNGRLVGLPNSISSTAYKYTWVFVLEVGCPIENNRIEWPGGRITNAFPCP